MTTLTKPLCEVEACLQNSAFRSSRCDDHHDHTPALLAEEELVATYRVEVGRLRKSVADLHTPAAWASLAEMDQRYLRLLNKWQIADGRATVLEGAVPDLRLKKEVTKLRAAVKKARILAQAAKRDTKAARFRTAELEDQNQELANRGWSWGNSGIGFVAGVVFALVVIPAIRAWLWGF